MKLKSRVECLHRTATVGYFYHCYPKLRTCTPVVSCFPGRSPLMAGDVGGDVGDLARCNMMTSTKLKSLRLSAQFTAQLGNFTLCPEGLLTHTRTQIHRSRTPALSCPFFGTDTNTCAGHRTCPGVCSSGHYTNPLTLLLDLHSLSIRSAR